jgi:hypothetical protein
MLDQEHRRALLALGGKQAKSSSTRGTIPMLECPTAKLHQVASNRCESVVILPFDGVAVVLSPTL